MTKEVNIYAENGVYRVRKLYKGVTISFTRKTQEEARAELKRRMNEVDEKIAYGLDINNRKSFEMVFDEFVESQNIRWKGNTRKYNISLFNNHFKDLKDIRINDLTDEIINQWILNIIKINDGRDGRNLSNVPYKAVILLHGILEFAIMKRYCSPFIDLTFKNKVKKVKTVTEKTEDNFLTYDDFVLLCSIILDLPKSPKAQKNEDMLFLIKFLYFTGLRINEARAIQKKDIQVKRVPSSKSQYRYYISVYKQFGDNDFELSNRLKSGNPPREVRIEEDVYRDLMNYLMSNGYEDDTYVFDFKKNGRPLYRSVISENIKRIIKLGKKEGLLPPEFVEDLSPHGFRFSNTMYLKDELNADVKTAAANLGHSVTVMLDIYSRIDRTKLDDVFSRKRPR